ncbi:MAG: response regulator [Alphaproteobacteria bacterium]|nr:response regulator [Alphaproteobacteria bacterium]
MTLRLKILALQGLVAIAVVGYLVFAWLPDADDNLTRRAAADTERHLDTVVESLIPFLLQGQYASIQENLDAVKARNPEWVALALFNDEGVRIYPVVAGAPTRAETRELQRLARNVVFENAILGRIEVSVDLQPVLAERQAMIWELAWVLAGAFVVALLGMGALLEIVVRRPVVQLGKAASQFAEGNHAVELPRAGGDEIGALTRTFAAMRDSVRDGKAALMHSEARFRDFSESAADWYFEIDANLRFSFMSEQYLKIIGKPAEFFVGRTRQEIGNPGVSDEEWAAHLEDLRAHRPFRNFIHPRTLPNGHVMWMQVSGVPRFDEEGIFLGYRGSGQDITQLKEAEIALQQAISATEHARQRAEAANKSKALFLSSMSHELRTPLNAILGFGQILKMNDLDDRLVPSVEQILSNGEHLLQLITQILDLSQIDSDDVFMEVGDVCPDDVAKSCMAMARPLTMQNAIHLVDRITGGELPCVRGDKTRLIQALSHLVSNGIKYNRHGGRTELSAERRDGVLRFKVSDQGAGISPQKQKQLFEPFSRLGAEGSNVAGTGIGLVLTRKLVERMDGKLGFESREGEGSAFWIDMPLAEPEDATSPAPMGGGRKLVLYVEDSPANADLMKAIFEDIETIELEVAPDAEQAFERIAARKPDMILMDIDLPGMDGREALAVLLTQDHTRDIPVVAVSADAMPQHIRESLDAGFRDYITKPFNLAKTIAVVEQTLSAR